MAYTNWNQVPLALQNILTDLERQYDMNTGGHHVFTNDELMNMANSGVRNLTDFGQFASTLFNTSGTPWANFGLDKDGFISATESLGSVWQSLTGQAMTPEQLSGAWNPMFGDALKRHLSAAEFHNELMNDANMKQTYGWLKYGQDYQSFQQTKLGMRTAFGHELTDPEAVQQLQYFHAAQGPNVSAQTNPTFTQQEKRTADVGVGQSVVR